MAALTIMPAGAAIDHANHSIFDLDYLRRQARWIRDDLDLQVARDGPNILHSDDVLNLDDLLRRLQDAHLRIEDIQQGRLHLAVDVICGKVTRWPKRLIERADALRLTWEERYGDSIRALRPPLHESGGRLHGICRPEDLSKEKLIIKWLKTPGLKLSPMLARRTGDLGFVPGDWWISPLFAFRDGIIDSADSSGGIVSDANGAYAILMADDEEIASVRPDRFVYRTKISDVGRYRLTAATRESRQPLRILRSHSLRSFWSPRAGVRYDGLHKVTGWTIRRDIHTREIVYEVTFQRLASERSMDNVLRRPFCDEVEDYQEYKRLRNEARKQREAADEALSPLTAAAVDGTASERSSPRASQARDHLDPLPFERRLAICSAVPHCPNVEQGVKLDGR